MLEQLITSFIAAAAFVIIFNAPRRTLLQCGLVGMISWFVYFMLVDRYDALAASLAATFIVGIVCQAFARLYKMPVIIFSVAGIIPLVPGGMAYDAMRNFVEHDYNNAMELAAEAMMISGSIAVGLVLSEVLNQMIRRAGIRTQSGTKS
ncbi:threonine/serine exporter family protein [Paenibacillus sp. JX-17]|uniref:Threonine/serine exporter family protein n=1 Tax=Paenibacillus lacisoli TaxID=3064525 RepID=A0ABT9CH51_9BACL|nr:threonine/serine exporter family protein [Paenibacillus sp. JX-17]MDO7908614.1 threonine/serine exporter family protein [Paenibacillus sp. JX-17]